MKIKFNLINNIFLKKIDNFIISKKNQIKNSYLKLV